MGPHVAFGTVLMQDKSQRFKEKVPTSLAESSSNCIIRVRKGKMEGNYRNPLVKFQFIQETRGPKVEKGMAQAAQLVRAGPRGGPWLLLPA